MKKYSVKVMQRAIEALTERDKTQKYYVEAYQTLLSIWGDGKLNREGKEFHSDEKDRRNELQHPEKKLT